MAVDAMASIIGNGKKSRLISKTTEALQKESEQSFKDSIKQLKLEWLKDHPLNEILNDYNETQISNISESIKEFGFNQPIVVQEVTENKEYTIISGHKRVRALKQQNKNTAGCIVLNKHLQNWQIIEYLIISNYGTARGLGEDYYVAKNILAYRDNVLKEKQASRFFIKDEIKGTPLDNRIKALSKVFSMSESSVKRYIAMEKYIPEFQELVKEKKLTVGSSSGLNTLDANKQMAVYAMVIEYFKKNENVPQIPRTEMELIVASVKGDDDTVKKIKQRIEDKKERAPRTTKSSSLKFTQRATSLVELLQKDIEFEDKQAARALLDELINSLTKQRDALTKDN